ncbi:TetR/AcrR family transcriptional regulator [Salinispirillum marinum]|uniref:TetR/AcrR family transcriptional regulator n=2 Tax=Saccharospirillaceae TaxID=255527 RepID=A0ABV8BBT0_9GAMM
MGAGRQRTFDKEDALIKAMEIFWEKGFSGTSLSDLTEGMGINKPSLYSAFGNKEELFVSAINQYANVYGGPHVDKLLDTKSSLQKRVQAYLKSIAKMVTNASLPGGCFVTASTSEAGSGCLPDNAVQAILRINADSTSSLVHFFTEEQAKGNLAANTSPEVLSDYLLTIQFGLAVMARNGTEQSRLEQVIDYCVSNF